jgi:hypothetical protein
MIKTLIPSFPVREFLKAGPGVSSYCEELHQQVVEAEAKKAAIAQQNQQKQQHTQQQRLPGLYNNKSDVIV